MLFVSLFVTFALLIIAFTMLLNVFTFPRLRQDEIPQTTPSVSILIPARNEASVITQTVQRHLAQDYPSYEVIVMDDKSDDGTGVIARETGLDNPKLTVIEGTAIPDGWAGKSWACHNLAQQASGDILIFTDADVLWEKTALSNLIAQMQRTDVDMLTVWSTQITKTWAERLLVPQIALVILGYLPTIMVHHSPFAAFAAANGQCMAWRREAYEAIGGHTVVANNVLDDVTLAKAAKEDSYRIRMVDGNALICARMYSDWAGVRDGLAKNVLAGYGNSVIGLVAGGVLHWLLFLFPFVMLFMDGYRLWGFLLITLALGLRALSAAFTKQRVFDALLQPLSVILMTRIAWRSIYWHYTGGPRWKGRILRRQANEGTG